MILSYHIIQYNTMLPIPMIMVLVICGIVVAYMVVETCYVSIHNIRNHMNKKSPPLNTRDECISNRMDNINEII